MILKKDDMTSVADEPQGHSTDSLYARGCSQEKKTNRAERAESFVRSCGGRRTKDVHPKTRGCE